MVGQSLTRAGFEVRTVKFVTAKDSNLSNALDHSAIPSGQCLEEYLNSEREA